MGYTIQQGCYHKVIPPHTYVTPEPIRMIYEFYDTRAVLLNIDSYMVMCYHFHNRVGTYTLQRINGL